MKLLFVEAKARKDVVRGLEKNISKISYKNIGLLAAVQFAHQLPDVKKFLQRKGFTAFIGKPKCSAVLEGQVLGCDVSAALCVEKHVDCFLYIGTGDFHPFGLLAKTEKPIYVLDPFTEKLREISKEEKQKIWMKQVLKLAQFRDCKTIGILVSAKPGQFYSNAEKLKEKLEAQGKKAYLFMCDSITNSGLMDFQHIDAWVNTACPRIAEDEFSKPVVNAEDVDDRLLNRG
jgi:2-(3-amino-3-carboxypropyl)histidine synthase